jgi:sugar lactone lactonase YvrE
MTDRLSEVMERLETQPLTTGHTFTEGPVWHPDGYFLFTDVPNIYRLDVDTGNLTTVRSSDAGSNGMTLDLQGRLVMCDGLHRRVTRMEPEGTITTVAGSYRGQQLNRPNDVVFRSDGTTYFTDPGAWAYHTPAVDLFKNFVYGVAPDGRVFQAAPFDYPNGLAFSPDESVLYVANTRYCKHIAAFDVLPDGFLINHRVFADLPQNGEQGVPDGIKVDVEGHVYCTGPGGLWVFDLSGEFMGKIRLPELPANLGWGDADNQTLYVTARRSVYRMRMKVPGTRMPSDQ